VGAGFPGEGLLMLWLFVMGMKALRGEEKEIT
jgi:hypothetical protein